MSARRLAPALLSLVLGAAPACAIDVQPAFPDAARQTRYENLTRELRCPQCQNNSIADSNAGIAADLRAELRAQIEQGRTDAEIRAFMTARYGDFVLYAPPLVPRTYLLWASPALLAVAGLGAAGAVILRRSRRPYAVGPDAGDDEADDEGDDGGKDAGREAAR